MDVERIDITHETRLRAAPTATAARMDDGDVVLLDVERSLYFGLGPVGARIWRQLEKDTVTPQDLVADVSAAYDAPPEHVEQDVLRLLHQLHAQGLTVLNPSDELEAERKAASDQRKRSAQPSEVGEALNQLRALRAEERIRAGGSRWVRPARDWWALIRAAALTVLIRAALSIWSLKTVTATLKRIARGLPQTGEATLAYRHRAKWAAHAVGQRLLPKRPCLTQALVLQYMLLRRGDDQAELHIGVAKGEAGELLAHAWIERNGRVLIGGASSPWKYRRLADVGDKLAAAASREQAGA